MIPVMEAKQLVRQFRAGTSTVTALDNVELAIARGEFVAVIGPSGSGKSTLLNLLAGLDRPTSGEVWIEGERIDGLAEAALARLRRRRIGFLFQSFNLLPTLSAGENVELPMRLIGVKRGEARRAAGELLAELNVGHRRESAPSLLSGGEQQRVALARALANSPAIVLADEPTGNLDSDATREVIDLLQRAARNGQSLLVVTHDARVAAAADRVVRMKDGRIASQQDLGARDAPLSQRLPEYVR